MKCLIEGHTYRVANLDEAGPANEQTIQFIHKVPREAGSADLVTVTNGTTNEEVLAVLIDRIQFLNTKFPCQENSIALTHLETALLWLNKRTNDRKARGVEGKAVK